MAQIKSKLEGRKGAGVLQPYRELRKLQRKGVIFPSGTTVAFRIAPYVYFASSLSLTAALPLICLEMPMAFSVDLFQVVGILLLGTVALALSSLDTSTAFGGMGASRELTIVALSEPTVLMAIYALSIHAHSSNIFAIVKEMLSNPSQISTPEGALAFIALIVVVITESGRLPVDNPSSHLELTMIHEAMILEHSGPNLGLIKLAVQMRVVVLMGLVANLFLPIGISQNASEPLGILIALVALIAKVGIFAALMAFAETFVAKLRLFRVPELLTGSFILGFLAVTASYFVPGIPR